jgi:hypothetical protein
MKSSFHRLTAWAPLLAALITALAANCSSADLAGGQAIDDPSGGSQKKKDKKPSNGKVNSGNDSKSRPDGSNEPADGLAVGDEASGGNLAANGGAAGRNDTPESEEELDDFATPGPGGDESASEALKALLDDCGAGDLVDAKPDDVIYQKNVTSLPVSKTKTGVTATAQTDLSIVATPSNTTQTNTVKIVKLDGPSLFVKIGKGIAEAEAQKNSGKMRTTNVPFLDIPALSDKHTQWDGVVCTVVPATKIEAVRGAYATTATLDPPAPAALSPRANGKRFAEEIGDQRVFGGITATVVSSNHPDLQGKTTLTGTITITKVASDANINGNAIQGDIAYKVSVDFGGPEVTNALGFIPEVTYFISFTKKDLAGNIADTKLEGNPAVTFIY